MRLRRFYIRRISRQQLRFIQSTWVLYATTMIANDQIEIMLSKPSEHVPFDKPVFTGSFYFRTDTVDELWNAVKSKSRICYPIENFDTVCVNLPFTITTVTCCSLAAG